MRRSNVVKTKIEFPVHRLEKNVPSDNNYKVRNFKIYLETSIFNTYFDEVRLERRFYTRKLFDDIEKGKYDAFVSQIVLRELQRAEEPKRTAMLRLLNEYKIKEVKWEDAIDSLAIVYIQEGVVPQKRRLDALHIAAATIHGLDIVVSYNCRHIARAKSFLLANAANKREGYKEILLHTPEEVLDVG